MSVRPTRRPDRAAAGRAELLNIDAVIDAARRTAPARCTRLRVLAESAEFAGG